METVNLKLIESDATTDKRVLEVYELLKRYIAADPRAKWAERRKTNWKAIENEIWTDAEVKEMTEAGQVPFVTNKLVKGVQGSCAVQTDSKPGIKFYPIGSGDLYVAELLKRGFDVVWEKNEGADVVYDFAEEAKVGAMAWLSVELDKSKNPFGRIEFTEEDPGDIYFDAESRKRDFSDTHIIKAKQRNWEYIKEQYPGIKEADVYFMPVSKDDAAKSEGVTGGDNYATAQAHPDHIDAQVKEQQKIIWEVEAWLIKTVTEDWAVSLTDQGEPDIAKLELSEGQKVEDVLKEGQQHWPRKITKRIQRIIVGKKLISEQANPLGEDADGEPVMRFVGMKAQRTRTAYAMSPTDYALPILKEKSKRRIQTIHAASHLINAPMWWVTGVKWHGNPGTPGSHAEIPKNIATGQALGRMSSGAVDVMQLVRLEEKADAEIDDQYDLQDVVKGKLPQGENMSGRLVLALQDMAGTMSKPSLRKLESALVRLAKVIVSMMLRHWPRHMWERLLEDDERENYAPPESRDARMLEESKDAPQGDEVKAMVSAKWAQALELIRPADLNKPAGLSLIDIDVKIAAGSSMPTNRIAKGEMAIQYLAAGMYDAQAALEYVDDPNKDAIIERMKNNAAMAAQMPKKGK